MSSLAAIFEGTGAPLRLRELDTPAPGAGEVLVRVSTCTLCASDLATLSGKRDAPTPSILGHEVVGQVEALGPGGVAALDGRPLVVGERVSWSVAASCGACRRCELGWPQKCESLFKYGHEPLARTPSLSGGLAQHVLLVSGSTIARVPAGLDGLVAAQANCAVATTAAGLRHAGELAGRDAIVFGAGPLGLALCAQLAAAGAARIALVEPDPARRALALEFGASDALESCDERGAFELSFDACGVPAATSASLDVLAPGGRALWLGAVRRVPALALDPEQLVRRCLSIQGVHNYAARDLEAALAFLAGPGATRPFAELVRERFALDDVEQAVRHAQGSGAPRIAVDCS